MPTRHDGDALDSDGGAVHDPRFDAERLDNLTLLALGETVPASFASHRAGCAQCQDDLAALSHTATLGRESVAHREYLDAQPPASVWSGIWAHRDDDAETAHLDGGAHLAGRPSVGRPAEGRPSAGRPASGDGAANDVAGDVGGADDGTGAVADLASRSSSARGPRGAGAHRPRASLRSRYGLAAAAVILAMAGATGGYVAGHSAGSAPHRLASDARLAQVPGGPVQASGAAALRSAGEGKQLTVTTAGLPLRSGFYEVWLYDPDRGKGGDMVAVGALGDHGRGTFTLPSGIDIRAYHVVNISAQNYGGGSAVVHGTSVLQGSLSE